jgi:hypothetical protein
VTVARFYYGNRHPSRPGPGSDGAPDPTDDLDADVVAPTATIGMVYDAVRAMHSLTVNDWLRAEAVAC